MTFCNFLHVQKH